jgi:aarF domain-containing kinase
MAGTVFPLGNIVLHRSQQPHRGREVSECMHNTIKSSDEQQRSKPSLASASANSRWAGFTLPLPRSVDFWCRACDIYASYKFTQLLSAVGLADDKRWDQTHERNSDKMVNLCLDLQGFYLKTGQFLGTRYDFMPPQFTSKLSQLHDRCPSMPKQQCIEILTRELSGGNITEHFSSLDLDTPIGSASIAQVHEGVWRKTNQKVAVKLQYPHAESIMRRDLTNLRGLAEFLQRTELKFDILSAIKELQRQIGNEFDFIREANNMDFIGPKIRQKLPDIGVPQSVYATKRLLVMTFCEGTNLGRLAEFKADPSLASKIPILPRAIKRRFGTKLLTTLASAWGEQLFVIKAFHADCHPGNICIDGKGKISLLDWGQVKYIDDSLVSRFSSLVRALNSKQGIVEAFKGLGIGVTRPDDHESIRELAYSLFDTSRLLGKYKVSPFEPDSIIKRIGVQSMPPDVYLIVRTIQLLRGLCTAFDIDFSVAQHFAKYAAPSAIAATAAR